MKKVLFFMILTVAVGTYTTSFATGAGENYKHQNEINSTGKKSTEAYLSNRLNYKHQNREKVILIKMNRNQKDNASSDYKHQN
ncbi:MAG TPA: hypothetical protein VK766_05120 [Cytophagaceae bacterium]|jgi:hypothetical protein|nr:hypothetical protein [Cytophagaceae bacterium]